MKKRPLGYLPLLVVLWTGATGAFASRAQAQTQGQVTGTVTSAAGGQPLSAVEVKVKGTSVATKTDGAGHYSLAVPSPRDTLVFTLAGYQVVELPVGSYRQIDVRLSSALALEQLVVTGYQVQKRGSVTGAVTAVNSEDLKDVPADNLSNALAGRLSGVTIEQNAGTPGRESSIRIRAEGTFNNSSPLYVIDGMVSDKFAFDGLSTSEIQNVTVLKDGAAAAVYGSRAANGVIVVTTKRGRNGPPRFSYTGSVGMQTPTEIPSSLSAYEQAMAINGALQYNNVPASDPRYFTDDELQYFQAHSYDWVDELWKNPIDTQHSLSVTGGGERVRYFLNGGYLHETGSFANLNFQRLNTRGNLDVDLSDDITASVDFSMQRQARHGPSWGGDDWAQQDLYKALALRTGMVPPYIDGLPVGNWVEWHPGVVISNVSGYDKRDWTTTTARARLEYRIPFLEGLSANVAFSHLNLEQHRKQFNLPYDMTVFNTSGGHNHIVGDSVVGLRPRSAAEYLMQREDRNSNYQLNGQLQFKRSFGDHNVDAMLVYEQAQTDYVWFDGRRDNFISRSIDQFIGGSAAPENSTVDGSERQSARISYVGSLGYDYNDTYLLNGSFRYDGSVIFAPERRWGFFPSISAGWRISNEPFFKVGFIDDLKLRASYAMLGNDAVGSFQWLQSYDIEDGAIFDSPSVGLRPGTLANRAITWEKSKSYDIGLDAAFRDRTVDLTLDYFRRNTYDILGSRQEIIPSTFGASLPDENYERINSHGFEASLGYNGHVGRGSGALDYHVRGNFGYATNAIAVLDEAENIRPYQSRIGRSTDAEFGYIATGILRTQADLDALPEGYTILGEKPRLGMLNYRDLRGPNSDEPDGRITSDDRDWIGAHSDPPINYGFQLGGSWKALSLESLFHGVAGNQLMMQTNGRDLQARIEESSYGYWADSWTPDNPDGAYPGYRGTNYRTRFPESSFWLRSGSFLRLKSVTLSYELPDGLRGGLGASGARLYATATNPVLLYDRLGDWGYDPEASNIRAYPLMRTFTLGVSIAH